MKGIKPTVLLILEGTYPYKGGGVSTWAHLLCSKVTNANFLLYSINAQKENTPLYNLPTNVKDVLQAPIWEPEEAIESFTHQESIVGLTKKDQTQSLVIEQQFIPLFKQLLAIVYSEDSSLNKLERCFIDLWEYFSIYDYKKTLTSKTVWTAYKESIEICYSKGQFTPSVYELTVGLRWLYHFLLPLTIPIPKVDICHLTLAGFPIIPALIAKHNYNTPIIISEHGVFIRERLLAINKATYPDFLKVFLGALSERITELAYYKADKVISVNQFNMKWETMYGVDSSKLEVIYNGIDTNLFKPQIELDTNRKLPTVVAAARIFELKDVLTMIRCCFIVKKQIPNISFRVYGNKNAVPDYTQKCENLIQELNLTEQFILAGHHSQPELIYAEGDISILTSVSEGFPYTVIESMSSGKPVVATDVGGVSEALDESCGFLCKPKDYVSLANRVIQLLLNDNLRLRMGENARNKVLKYFTIEKFIQSYMKIYNEYAKTQKSIQEASIAEVKEAS